MPQLGIFSTLSTVFGCLRKEPSNNDSLGNNSSIRTLKDQRLSRSDTCVFCRASVANGFDVVWEDDKFTVFRDINPSAVHHLLVIPKMHIDSVKSLSKLDLDLVAAMRGIANHVLEDLNVPQASRRLGFHIPPFNSVHHLHLHVQALPYKSQFRKLKYPVITGGEGRVKGFSWFAEIDQTLSILEKDGKVGVFPC